MPNKAVVEMERLYHSTVKDLDKRYMQQQMVRAGMPAPCAIGIDEISFRKGHNYRVIVSDLERGRFILVGGERRCVCGCELTRIGEEINEQLDIVPTQIRVMQHVRGKYACTGCEQTVQSAPLPAQPILKSLASPGLLAHIAVAKYQDALPLYRQRRSCSDSAWSCRGPRSRTG